MASLTRMIDSGIRMVKDNYISIRSPNWTATQNTSSLAKYTEEEIFPGEFYGGIHNASFRFMNITIPQGATITSAKITFIATSWGGPAKSINFKIAGIDEDNTGEFTTSPIDTGRTRTKTTALVDWDPSITFTYADQPFDTSDFSSVIQEIVSRGGWSSGNALGLYFYDDGTTIDHYLDFKYYSSYPTQCPLLTITYEYGGSASVSPSASASPSKSPSSSASPSTSVSPSPSASASASPSPSPLPPPNPAVLKIAKPGVNVLTDSDVENLIFSSEYGTLKYFDKQTSNLTINASGGDIACHGQIAHNLGYYPFVEVFVSVYIGSPTGVYEYCPYAGAGASVFYGANVKVDTTNIDLYGEILGMSASTWHFDFIVFIFKNKIDLT